MNVCLVGSGIPQKTSCANCAERPSGNGMRRGPSGGQPIQLFVAKGYGT